jgi:hypothetical protein
MVPQLSPAGQAVMGLQPQTFAVPAPPQVCGAAHEPQEMVPPHPSGMVPQLSPAGQAVMGTQTQMSSEAGVEDCAHVLPLGQFPLVAVHASQAPKSTFAELVSQ